MSNQSFFSNLSISKKILYSVLAVLFCGLAVGGHFLNQLIQNELRSMYYDAIDTLAVSLEDGVKGSLERGQMLNFKKLLASQKKIKGVVDISLYDRTGKINLSSSQDVSQHQQLSLIHI